MALYQAAMEIPGALRTRLIRAFTPRHERVFCQQVTWAYGVQRSYPIPREAVPVEIYGTYLSSRVQTLLCQVGDDGRVLRDDQVPFHITMSVLRDVPPKEAKHIVLEDVALLPEEDRIRFRLPVHIKYAQPSPWDPIELWT